MGGGDGEAEKIGPTAGLKPQHRRTLGEGRAGDSRVEGAAIRRPGEGLGVRLPGAQGEGEYGRP